MFCQHNLTLPPTHKLITYFQVHTAKEGGIMLLAMASCGEVGVWHAIPKDRQTYVSAQDWLAI